MKIFGFTIIKTNTLNAIINRETKAQPSTPLKLETKEFIQLLLDNGFTLTGSESVGVSKLHTYLNSSLMICFWVNYDGSLSSVYKGISASDNETRIKLLTDVNNYKKELRETLSEMLKMFNLSFVEVPTDIDGNATIKRAKLESASAALASVVASLREI